MNMSVLPLNRRVIYALVDPRDGIVRYVGSTDSPQRRLKEHLRFTKHGVAKNVWIKELIDAQLKPLFVFIDSVPSGVSDEKELFWIAHFSRLGNLFNTNKK